MERDLRDESYLPTFHVHCLLGDIDEVTMTLAEPLRRGRRPHAISAELHDPYCVEAAREMAKQAAVPLAGPVTLEQVVAAYRERIRELESEAYPVDLFSDVIGLCAYFGRRDTAERALDQLAERMKKWSEKTMPAAEVAQLLAMLRGWIAAPEMLRSLEATQAKLLRVEHLPTSALVS